MLIFLNAFDVEEESLDSVVNQAKVSRFTVDFITSIRATTVSLGMYPPGSKTIANAVEKVSNNLQKVLEMQSSITFSEVNGLLLVDGQQLDERDRKRAPVIDFTTSLIERNIQSLTFKKKTSAEELINFLVLLSKKPNELKELGSLPALLEEKGIANINLNERIYVATTQEEEENRKHQEQLLAKMLSDDMGDDVDTSELLEMMGDTEEFSDILKSMIVAHADVDEQERSQAGGEEDIIAVKAQKLIDVMARGYYMTMQIADEGQKEVFKDSLAEAVAEFEPEVIGSVLYNERQNPTDFSKLEIEQNVFDHLDSGEVLDLTQYVIEEVSNLKQNAGRMSPEERQVKIAAIKDLVKTLINTNMERSHFPEMIEKLQGAGLIKESVAEQLVERAETAAPSEDTRAPKSFLNNDGTVNREALDRVMEMYDRLTVGDIASVTAGLKEIVAEVIFHPNLDRLVDIMVRKMEEQLEFNSVYKSISDFLEHAARELIFNEGYETATKISTLFKSHCSEDAQRNHDQKLRAQSALDMVASEEVIRMLLTVYQHGEPDMLEKVSKLISQMGNRMLNALLELLKSSEDRKVRRKILDLLSNMGGDVLESVRMELGAAGNPWYVHRNMLVLLEEIGNQDHAEWVVPLVSNEDPRVRKEAAKALAALDPNEAADIIRPLISDSDLGVKRIAISLLGVLKDTESIPMMADFISKRTIAQVEEDDGLQIDAITAMSKIGDRSVVPYLLTALKKEGIFSKNRTKNPEVRARACFALAAFQYPEVEKAIKAASKDGQSAVAEAAKSVLSRF